MDSITEKAILTTDGEKLPEETAKPPISVSRLFILFTLCVGLTVLFFALSVVFLVVLNTDESTVNRVNDCVEKAIFAEEEEMRISPDSSPNWESRFNAFVVACSDLVSMSGSGDWSVYRAQLQRTESRIIARNHLLDVVRPWSLWLALLFVVISLVLGFSYFRQRIVFDAERLKAQVAKQLGASTEEPYFNKLVTINVQNLAAYYSLVKIQTNNSFYTSLVVAIAGFVLIVIGLSFAYTQSTTDLFVGQATDGASGGGSGLTGKEIFALIATGAGIITEFIAAVFFYLYNQTVRQLKDYHDSLLDVQNILISFKIVEDVKEAPERGAMVSQMISYLIGQKQQMETPPVNEAPPATD